MKKSDLTDALLSRIPPAVRTSMRLPMTQAEAEWAFIVSNERDLHKQIKGLLGVRSIWYCYSRTDKKTTQAKGVPDFLCCVNGTPLALEAKFAKGRTTEEQESTMAHMRKNGWQCHVVRSVEEVKTILDSLLTAKP